MDKKKVIQLICKVLWWCALLSLFVLLVSIFSAKITGKVPKVLGYSVIHIVSGSMEDEIPEDSYILIKSIKPEKVKKNDVICFYSEDPAIYGMPNTHRVAEDPIQTSEGIEFVTKGDANPANDKIHAKAKNLIGIYVCPLNGISKLSVALEGNTSIIVILCLQICMISMALYAFFAVKSSKKKTEAEGEKMIELDGVLVTEAEIEAARRAMEEKEAEPPAEEDSAPGQEG